MNNTIEVLKFGGTSVGSKESIKQTCDIVSALETQAVVVVSAFCGITNKLSDICRLLTNQRYEKALLLFSEIFDIHFEMIESLDLPQCKPFLQEVYDYQMQLVDAVKILNEISAKTMDAILSCGELMSSKIIAEYYNCNVGNTIWLDSRKIIATNSEYTDAEVDYGKSKILCESVFPKIYSQSTKFVVCGGFIGADNEGFTTTIGRGGSDHSAAVIAMGIKADVLKVYTDVTGIKTTDPKLIPSAITIESLSYDEAFELAESGAKVLHPNTILPALNADIPVCVLNTNEPFKPGTAIITNSARSGSASAIAIKDTLINISLNLHKDDNSILSLTYKIIADYNIKVEALLYTKNNFTITLQKNLFVNELVELLERFGELSITDSVTALTIVGEKMGENNDIISNLFALFDSHNIKAIKHYINKNSIKIIVPTETSISILQLLHNEIVLKNVNFE